MNVPKPPQSGEPHLDLPFITELFPGPELPFEDVVKLVYESAKEDLDLGPYELLDDPYKFTLSFLAQMEIERPGMSLFGIEEGDHLIGLSMARIQPGRFVDHGILEVLAVDEALRGQGYGARLLEASEERLIAEGASLIALSSSGSAIDFYAQHGYEHGMTVAHEADATNPMFKEI